MLFQLTIFALIAASITADSCESYSHPQYGKTGRCMKASSCSSNIYLPNLCESKPINVECCFNMTMSNKDYPRIIRRADTNARNSMNTCRCTHLICNNRLIDIPMIGDYKSREAVKLAIDALESLIQCGASRYYIQSLYTALLKRHRQ